MKRVYRGLGKTRWMENNAIPQKNDENEGMMWMKVDYKEEDVELEEPEPKVASTHALKS